MNNKELQEYKTVCQYINGKLIPCVVVISHLEANAEIEKLGKNEAELLMVNRGLLKDINHQGAEIEKLKAEVERVQKKLADTGPPSGLSGSRY